MKPDRKKWPRLAKAWDEYGHLIKWENLFDIKASPHGYAVVAWMEGDLVNYADLSQGYGDDGQDWEFQNDGHDPIPLAVWKKAKIIPNCDWLDIN